MVTVGLVAVLAALPPFGDPSLLVDIDTGPSPTTQAQLVEANEQGVLYTQVERDGGTALFWSSWEGAAQRVFSVLDAGVKARRFGDSFIVFSGAAVERLDVSPAPQLTSLTPARDLSYFLDTNSTDALWWAGSEGTFVTDGSSAGTRLVAANQARIALGTNLFSRGTRAGDHVVIGAGPGTPVRNELGEDLPNSSSCFVFGGGESAWLGCRNPDGGQELMTTDGTPAGTSTRFRFASGEQWIDTYVASADYFVLDARLSGTSGNHVLARAGSAPPQPLGLGCFAYDKIVGDVLIGNYLAIPLSSEFGTCQRIGEVASSRQVGRRALLQVKNEGRFLLTDGTDGGSVSVPASLPDWPTASSAPSLVGSDGVRAIYSTTQGAWVTDGTASGTMRVGIFAEFFGHSVLAQEDGRFAVFAPNGDRWEPPVGVLGVAGGILVGRNGCDAFTVDEDRVRRELPSVGCVAETKLGKEGALVRNSDGITSLIRVEGAFALAGEVELVGGVRCGKKVCWYISRQEAVHLPNIVDLESGGNTTIPTILTQDHIELVAAIDSVLVFSHPEGAVAVRRTGGTLVMEQRQSFRDPTLRLGVTTSGSIVWTSESGGGLNVFSGRGDSTIDVPCSITLGLSVTGDRVNVLCTSPSQMQSEVALWSGRVGDEFRSIAVGTRNETAIPHLPTGDDKVLGFMMTNELDDTGRFVFADEGESRSMTGLLGGEVARVRAGYVFAATLDSVRDFELWVLPVLPSGCGCSGGGAELAMVLGLLLFRRRRATVA